MSAPRSGPGDAPSGLRLLAPLPRAFGRGPPRSAIGTVTGRFLFLFVLLCIVPILVLGGLTFFLAAQEISSVLGRRDQEHVTTLGHQLDIRLAEVQTLVGEIAASRKLREAIAAGGLGRGDDGKLRAMLDAITVGHPRLKGAVAVEIIGVSGPGLSVFHQDGPGRAGAQASLHQVTAALLAAFAAPRSHSVWVRNNPEAERSGQFASATVAQAIYAPQTRGAPARMIAVAMVHYSIRALARRVGADRTLDGSVIGVVDAAGHVAAHPDADRIGEILPAAAQTADSNPLTSVPEPMLSRSEPLRGGWSVIRMTPPDVVHAHTAAINAASLAIVGFAALAVSLGALLYSRAVSAPIRRITEQLKRIGSDDGETPPRLPVSGGGDIAELTRWFNTFLDTVDESRRSEAARREIWQRYELALRATSDAVFDWDIVKGHIDLAPHFAELVGIAVEELGHSPSTLVAHVHPDDLPRLRQRFHAHLESREREFEIEFRLLHASGRALWICARCYTLRGEDGAPIRMVGSLDDITERKRAEDKLLYEATHDGLTGLANRTVLFEAAAQATAMGGGVGLVLIDVDNFKDVNDTLGHAYGDAILKAIADVLHQRPQNLELGARLGGDEFALLRIAGADEAEMRRTAMELRAALAEPIEVADARFLVSVSGGLALAAPGDDANDLMRKADLALYAAKNGGRNRFSFFDESLDMAARARFAVESRLRAEAPADAIHILLQPQVSARDPRSVTRIEVLSRWVSPVDGAIIGPDRFIAAAERIGVVNAVTRTVVSRALDALHAFDRIGRDDVVLAVNLSPFDLSRSRFAHEMMDLIERSGIAPGRLEFEITEGSLVSDTPTVYENMHLLSQIGCRFALDDFGTGYSSLAYLRRFPIHVIKIDRAFLEDAPGDASGIDVADMTAAVVTLGHSMGKIMVAEGIETEDVAAILARNGCDFMQGYYFHRPMPLADALALLADRPRSS